jgi:hypothetical protein
MANSVPERYTLRGGHQAVLEALESHKASEQYLERIRNKPEVEWALVQYMSDDLMIVTVFSKDNEIITDWTER